MRLRSSRVNTMVVETAVLDPPSNSLSTAAPGSGRAVDRTTRRGSGPPSAARRSSMYLTSSESGPGWKYGGESVICSSGIGSSRRSRKTLSSSFWIFFAWWVMFRPSIPRPRVQPLTVLARITVGAPVNSVAALYAA